MTENDFFADNTVADKPKVSADEFKEEWAGFHYVDEQEPEFRHQRDEIDELLYPEIPVADLETDFLPEAREKLRAQIRAVKDNKAMPNMLTEKDKTVADEVADAAGKEPYFHDLYAWAVDDKKFLDIISAKGENVANDKGRSRELNRKLIELRLKYEDSLNDHNKYPGRRIRFENLLD